MEWEEVWGNNGLSEPPSSPLVKRPCVHKTYDFISFISTPKPTRNTARNNIIRCSSHTAVVVIAEISIQ